MHSPSRATFCSAAQMSRAVRLVQLLACLTAACSGQVPRPTAVHTALPAPPKAAVAAPAPTPVSDQAPTCPRALSLSVAELSAEASCLLRAYVRIDTQNPPGHELAAAHFLRDVLAREGIASEIIESAPGRANLIARLRASDASVPAKAKGAIVLTHHMDVVPANASEWSMPPFAGEERDGALWGRGSFDNKGGGVIELLTVLMLKRLATPLARDVVLLAVADEEAGGALGARFLTEQRMDLFRDVEFVLAEGGAIVKLEPGHPLYSVELAQKAPLWLRITARGHSGHGATPHADSAVTTLLRALSRLAAFKFPILVLPEVQTLYALKAPGLPAALRAGALDLRAALAKPAFRELFFKEPRDAAMVQNTLAITMLRGSDKENVVPGEASAVLDVRLLPGQDAEQVTRELTRVMAEAGLEVTPLLSWRAYASPRDTPLFHANEALAQARDPGAPVIPNVNSGFTDCNAFRAHDVTCYGFMPLRVKPEAFAGIHGKDERMVIGDLSVAIADLHALLLSLR